MAKTLKQLSEAATRGAWYPVAGMIEVEDDAVADPASCYAAQYSQESLTDPQTEMANAEFIATLVNMYRSGQLVEVN